MEQEKILLKLFETLKEKGFEHPVLDKTTWWRNKDNRIESIEGSYHYAIIFDHKFAEFIWGSDALPGEVKLSYEIHLAKMVEEEDYLEYIEREYLNF